MALTESPPGELGSPAPDFALAGVDGRVWRLADFGDRRALCVMFICNHCPYVKAIADRLARLGSEYLPRGAGFVAINANDASAYPEDGLPQMRTEARTRGYPFPYLQDESQSVARAYGAVCTPDLFVYAPAPEAPGSWGLAYRGRLDDAWKDEAAVRRRDLAEALDAVLAGRAPAPEQISSMGCSLKWKAR